MQFDFLLKARETHKSKCLQPVRNMFMTFELCSELQILLPNTTSKVFSSYLQLQPETPYWQYIKRVLNPVRSIDW